MDSQPANDSESSLPITQPDNYMPSSPPVVKEIAASFDRAEPMEDLPALKSSEPSAMQVEEATKPPLRRISSEETERPPSAQQVHGGEEEHVDVVQADDDDEELDSDPAEKIDDFDWDALHERYHEAMQGCHNEEGELAQEWESLMNYFRIWADSGHDQETDRTYKRLKTRTGYVQNSEDKLEQTRRHYVSVVKAFESALQLLKAHDFDG